MSLTNDQITAQNFKDYHNAILPYLNGGRFHSGFTPIGTIISVMGTQAPQNYLACNGQTVNIADYPELANYFNAQFGASNFFGGNGTTTFAVPDLRGEFLRGTGTNSHANQGSGANVGVHQDGTTHWYSAGSTVTSSKDVWESNWDSDLGNAARQKANAASNDSSGQLFTSRPTNTSVLYCIATKNFVMDASCHYSTDEQVVGTWIDGKPIYQKTYDCGTMPNNTTKSIAHNITNLEKIIREYGEAHRSTDGANIPIPFVSSSSDYVRINTNATDINIVTVSDRRTWTCYVTLQYTKTTDG